MVDDRAIILRSFGHTLDLVDSLLAELPDTDDHMRARKLAVKFRDLIARSKAANNL